MASIGEELKLARHEKGFSIKDIEQALHIRAAYLEAIEENNYKLIPGDVYVKGFIRNYANYVGLPAQKMVDRYKTLIGEEIVSLNRTRKQSGQSKEEKTKIHRRLTAEGRAQRRKKALRREQFMLFAFVVFITVFMLWLFM